ncbi:MAG: exosortase A [Alphaproteobacteria bacterium]
MNVADLNTSESSPAQIKQRQRLSLVLLLAGIAVLTWLAWQSVTNMVQIWLQNSAYNHGFFILPIAGYMAWERRHRLAGLSIEPYWPGLILVAGFSSAWLVARGASIMEGEQIAYIGLIQGLMLTLLGRRIFRAQILPIQYLWLMVPTGGFLIPGLQAVATWLASHLLALTGVPFYVEQFYFQLPVGLFFVAPGCSGLNFLLAALALSIIYAELMYVGWKRKVICILTWLGVAILANGVRIFGILWLAEVTNRQIAIVDDHLLYGWGFFFAILIGLMIAGKRFSNLGPLTGGEDAIVWLPSGAASVRRLTAAALVPVLTLTAMIGYGLIVFSDGVKQQGLDLADPGDSAGWRLTTKLGYSDKAFANADVRKVWRFKNGEADVNLFAAYYGAQWDGHEAVADNQNILGAQEIKITGRAAPAPVLNGVPRRLKEETVTGARNNILIWRWYCAGDYFTPNPLEVRLRSAASRLLRHESAVTVFTLFTLESDTARARMTSLLEALRVASPGIMVLDANGLAIGPAICW